MAVAVDLVVNHALTPVDDQQDRTAVGMEIRRELARGFHDTLGQTLTGALIRLETLRIDPAVDAGVKEELAFIQSQIRDSLNGVRRMLYGMREEPAAEAGLPIAIRRLLDRCESSCPGVHFELHALRSWPGTISATAADHLYRIVEEAVTNAIRHSAAGHVLVRLELSESGEAALLSVSDDGEGLPPATGMRKARFGLVGARERVTLMGGELRIESTPGRGTRFLVSIPVELLL